MATSTISLGGNINELAKITLDTVTNTSGAYSHTTTVSGITPDHKVLSIECGNESAFRAPVTINTATNAITLSCDSVVGSSTVIVYVQMTGDNVPITSLEYSALSTRVGNLSDLGTSDKSSVINAINELHQRLQFFEVTGNFTNTGWTVIGNIGTNKKVYMMTGTLKTSVSEYLTQSDSGLFRLIYSPSSGNIAGQQQISTSTLSATARITVIYE